MDHVLAAVSPFAHGARQYWAWLFQGPCCGRWNRAEVSAGVHAKVRTGANAHVPMPVLGSMWEFVPGLMKQCQGLCQGSF